MLERTTPRPPEIPPHLWGGIRDYLLDHQPVGGFLTAVFENDLMRACCNADYGSAQALPGLARWLMNEAPAGAFGSPAAVRAWLRGRADR